MENNSSPMVSVVMCCYNAEKYLKETIDSVLSQTYNDFEFIIWNDGSTDGSEDIINQYKDKRIVYFKDINRGEGQAAKLACSKARGKYIARIDADDVCYPNRLEEEVRYLEKNPNVVLVSCLFDYIDENSKYLGRAFPLTSKRVLKKSITTNNSFIHSGSMYTKEAYDKTGGYLDIKLCQDYLLFRSLSKLGDIAILEKPLVKYRLLQNSVAHQIVNSPYYNVIQAYQQKIYKDHGVNKEDISMFNQIYHMSRSETIACDTYKYRNNIQNIVFNKVSIFFGDTVATSIILLFKNIWYNLKFL